MLIRYKHYEKITNFIYRLQLLKLKLLGAKIGKGVKVYGTFFVAGDPKNLIIGDRVTINHGVFFNCREKLTIASGSRLSSYAKIYTTSLTYDRRDRKHISAPTILGENVWIASGAIVTMGVVVGDDTVLAANSIALDHLESGCLYAGNPAKKIKKIDFR